MADKLLQCPFCGGEVVLQALYGGNYVECGTCKCSTERFIKMEDAIKAWNNRPSPWHTGTPTEEGDYLVAFRMSDNSVEYGWCNWNNGAWDILCDYDTTDGSCGMIAWQKIEPCNWFDFLFSEGHCDNWREVR